MRIYAVAIVRQVIKQITKPARMYNNNPQGGRDNLAGKIAARALCLEVQISAGWDRSVGPVAGSGEVG